MGELLQIDPAASADSINSQRLISLPVLVLDVNSRCNCRCVMCDIWKNTDSHQLSISDLRCHLQSIRDLKVRWVVLTGGEPLLNPEIAPILETLRALPIRITLLSTGLLLERYSTLIANTVDEVIVSLDGPPEIHDRIRRVRNAFTMLQSGVQSLRTHRPDLEIGARATVQNANHEHLRGTTDTAQKLNLNWISFLAADLSSAAFNREIPWTAERRSEIALTKAETITLEREIELLIDERELEIETGFIRESPAKLRRLLSHFRAALGLETPVAPLCNAPWVSAVMDARGSVRPCFFHQPVGNARLSSMQHVINSPAAIQFREKLDVATNETCRRCVCSLNYTPSK